ncbi:MFS general substrate transporter [Cutaneotrichosporon oleaginosum]|uniref:MFS general substrate transporter n=1 Tax=Cutaneotrichosporon oleaginosum TaxID=879819 RepID=A0A0J0XB04_9TREE|nr:MFS general substrate transporter [Cutaneotrichosporon oleaginosum]KLT38287.1 MFS general substrate transporter [Cutaneotrichosporon oleaginosum]TXT12661.1 hypothetical protein COLE_03071 [Cutaneotrichosporon oleaginosum]
MFYNLSSMLAKTATLLLYIRMASAHPFLRYASYVVLAIVDIAGIVLVFMNIFQCRPIAAAWQPHLIGECYDNVTLFLASAPVNILSDIAILMLPLPIITELRMERRAKIALVTTFMCGVFVAAVDVVRIAYLQISLKEQIQMGTDHVNAYARPVNFYWYTAWGLMWSAIECCVRLCCTCALVLKPLLQRLKERGRQISSNNNSPNMLSRGPAGDFGEQMPYTDAAEAASPGIDFAPGKEPQSPRNLPLAAILETSPDVPDEDTMDIMAFFNAGPPTCSPPTPSLSTVPNQPRPPSFISNGHAEMRANGISNGAAAAAPSTFPGLQKQPSRMSQGGPLHKQVSRLSHKVGAVSALAMLSTPVRWITNDSVPLEYKDQTTQHFFDFVQMGGRKPLTQLTAREAWWPVLFVSILFFLWGFSYGLLGNLTTKILQTIATAQGDGATPAPWRELTLQLSYWIGYVIGPLTVGIYVLHKHGFKATFVTGLVLYACGCMCFWPSSVLASYGGFIFANILIAIGLSVLEVAANPFIALAGPGELSEARLNFSQGIQAIGGLFSPILAQKGLFSKSLGREALFDVQWCYLAVALFVLVLTLVFFYVPLSEATDCELEEETNHRLAAAGIDRDARAYHMPARWFVIGAGVFTLAVYIGQQESLSYYWDEYISEVLPHTDSFWDLQIGHGLFAAGRFIAAGICYAGFTPRLVLNVCCLGSFITTLLAVFLPAGKGAFTCVLLAMFFESPVFPTLFATALRGQGKHTKFASVALTTAIGAGTLMWQPATFGIERRTREVRTAFILIAVLCGVQMIYPAMLAARPVLRGMVDPRWSRVSARRVSAETFGSTEKSAHVEVHPASSEDSGSPKTSGGATPQIPGTPAAAPSATMPLMNLGLDSSRGPSGAPPPPRAHPPPATNAGEDLEFLGLVGDLPEIKM